MKTENRRLCAGIQPMKFRLYTFLIVFFFISVLSGSVFAQNGIGDNFNNNNLSCQWHSNTNYALTNSNSELMIAGSNAGASYNNFNFSFNPIDISANPNISVQIKTTTAVTIRIDLVDANGKSTNASPVTKSITNSGTYTTFTFSYTGKFNQSSPATATVDPTKITSAVIFFNAGGAGYNGTVYFDNFQIGTGGPTDGGASNCIPVINYNIRLNQIGFYTNLEKIAIVAGNPAAGNFYVKSLDLATTYYTGTLGASATWTFSNETVRAADFTAFTTPGKYVLDVPGVGYSPPFIIDADAFNILSKTVLKGFYYKRASTAITTQYGGVYARAAGHPDTQVMIHSSAASPGRPANTLVSSPKGWYDAGDYGCYVVNSGISTFTLMSSYEHFKAYYDTLPLNIPESGNGTPDILNEVKWNLDWMLTMQDPYDGGVYHKKTTAAFDPFEMPAADQAQRYLIGKATAATFDFAAVMAVAYRVYLPYNPTFANQCLAASKKAYTWGIANPSKTFTNPSDISTGEYGDGSLGDEKEWAATELYISTKDDSYYSNSFKSGNSYAVPSWPLVNTLGLMSLVHHRKNLTTLGYADTTAMKNKLFAIANPIRTHKTSGSAYKTGMGTNGNSDFVWGSNSTALNQGMICMASYLATNDITYANTAISELDYVLGRNATTYCFVSGLGSKPVMNPHDRISGSDGIVNPVPGWIAGGPCTDARNDCGAALYPSANKAMSYLDQQCSYSTNEIAINWNAPLVFVGVAMQYLNRTDLNPEITVLKGASSISNNNSPALALGTAVINTAAAPVTITIKNTGAVPLTISSITGTTGFAVSALSPASPVAAGASATFTITATPSVVGTNTGTVKITTNDQTTTTFVLNVSVTGATVPKPILAVSKGATTITSNNTPALSLGTAVIAIAAAPVTTITITNSGDAPLNVTSITGVAGFEVSALNPVSPVAAGASATFTITATPSVVGANTGTVTIQTNDPATPTFTLNVSVTGTPPPAPILSVLKGATAITSNNAPALSLGTAVINTAAAPVTTITLTNSGNAPLNVTSITGAAGFAVSALSPASPVAAGSSATFTITATPSVVGANTGTVTIQTNDPATPTFLLNVSVTGTPPPAPILSVSQGATTITSNNAPALSLGTAVITIAAAPVTTMTITNSGDAPLNVTSITGVSGFAVSALSPASPVAAGSSATFTITATPSVVGANTGTVTIQTNDAVTPTFVLNVSVTGTPAPQPVIAVSKGATSIPNNNAPRLALGSAIVGVAGAPVTITITNSGNAPLNVTSITGASGFAVSALSPASPVAAGASATFTITGTPSVVGANNGTITIQTNDPTTPTFLLNVKITGTTPPQPVLVVSQGATVFSTNNSPALLLGTSVVGTAADPVTITISNSGVASLSVSAITGSSGFIIGNLSPASPIAAGASATFTITAIPSSQGSNAGTITIISNYQTTPSFVLNVDVTGTLTAGTTSKLSADAILVHPNPTSGAVAVQMNGTFNNTYINVYNALGALVLSAEVGTVTNTSSPLFLDDCASGIYFVEIITDEGTSLERVIKE